MVWRYLELKGKAKLEWAESELKHEMQEGVHTFSPCKCGRRMCRSNMCEFCWKEEINRLKEEEE